MSTAVKDLYASDVSGMVVRAGAGLKACGRRANNSHRNRGSAGPRFVGYTSRLIEPIEARCPGKGIGSGRGEAVGS